MVHIVLLHGLHMHPWSLFYLAKELKRSKDLKVSTFGYHSTLFSFKTVDKLKDIIEKIPIKDEVYIVGHSMGGLIGRIFLDHYSPKRKISLITLGAPHYGSLLGKTIHKSIFKILMGKSGESGIVKTLTPWKNNYPLYCIAGISKIGVASIVLAGHPDPHDGTVFVKEAIVENCTESFILENTTHSQMIISKKVLNLISQIIENNKEIK